MVDWVNTILATPFLMVPIVAFLWSKAKFPEMHWKKIFLGVILTFVGSVLHTLALSLSMYSSYDWFLWIISGATILGNSCHLIGLGIIGVQALIDAVRLMRA